MLVDKERHRPPQLPVGANEMHRVVLRIVAVREPIRREPERLERRLGCHCADVQRLGRSFKARLGSARGSECFGAQAFATSKATLIRSPAEKRRVPWSK
jgi:hypothetical protein